MTKRFSASTPLRERITAAVVVDQRGCWLWQRAKTQGYGVLRVPNFKSLQRAHRVAYQEWRSAIPAGLEIDHLCRVRHCCNPWHMEAVTPQENNRRSESRSAKNARKTKCSNDHPYTEDSTYVRPDGGRNCRICDKDYQRRKRSNS